MRRHVEYKRMLISSRLCPDVNGFKARVISETTGRKRNWTRGRERRLRGSQLGMQGQLVYLYAWQNDGFRVMQALICLLFFFGGHGILAPLRSETFLCWEGMPMALKTEACGTFFGFPPAMDFLQPRICYLSHLLDLTDVEWDLPLSMSFVTRFVLFA